MCGRQWGSLFEDNSSSSKAKWNTATAPCTNLVVLRCCCGGAEVRHCFQPGRTLWFHCYCCVCGDSKHLSSTFRMSDKVSYVVSMMVYRTTVVMMLVKPMSLVVFVCLYALYRHGCVVVTWSWNAWPLGYVGACCHAYTGLSDVPCRDDTVCCLFCFVCSALICKL